NDCGAYANQLYKASGAVFACAAVRMVIFSEARLCLQEYESDRPGDVKLVGNKKAMELFRRYGEGKLMARAIQDVDMAGNHYVVREQIAGGGPRLKRLRPDWVTIMLDGDPNLDADVEIVGYIYKPGNTEDKAKWKVYPADGSNG